MKPLVFESFHVKKSKNLTGNLKEIWVICTLLNKTSCYIINETLPSVSDLCFKEIKTTEEIKKIFEIKIDI